MSAERFHQIIRRPIITEKANDLQEQFNQYTFEVDPKANKIEIRHAIEAIFGVKVASVRTSIVRGKKRRVGRSVGQRRSWKKAVVALREGHEIDFFGEV